MSLLSAGIRLFSLLALGFGVCCCLQTDESAYLQNILNTGPLSTGSAAPEKSGDSSLQRYLRDQYHTLRQQIKIGAAPHASQRFDAVQICPSQGNSTGEPRLLNFLVDPAPADPNLLISAILRIHLFPSNSFIFETIQAFQIVKGQPLDAPDAHRLLSTQFISNQPRQSGQWIEFNVLPAVSDWLKGARPNLGFLVSGLHNFNGPYEQHQPILVIKYDSYGKDDAALPRFEIYGTQNESFVQTDETIQRKSNLCKRHELWVDFQKWGMVEPTKFDIGFCSGGCGKDSLGVGCAEHTALMALLSENNTNIGAPQCAPIEYGPMAVMYVQANGNYVVKKVGKMSVRNCDCR